MGIILFIVALPLVVVLSIPALLHTIAGAIRWKGEFRYVDRAFFNGARAIDIFGNVAYGSMLNDLFIKRGGYHYGQGSETISSATGKNWVLGKLTFLGMGLAGTLNLIDKDHCWKYIEGDRAQYDLLGKPKRVPIVYTLAFIITSIYLLYMLVRLFWWITF
ncbi:hypothetical protein [Dyadobacter sandarakinus]|uniref:Uncharacterized protein n=1 Tax=Dyadobacter sandarakinus TaxID=2747268 RepID=A0ABX7I3B6_9BACT|nr:hypothetical protein [Dyadobacter sandarakinus]QRQ99732.1 hypothetical protein HWI92_01770 [Dyadobacter sandarakinus]